MALTYSLSECIPPSAKANNPLFYDMQIGKHNHQMSRYLFLKELELCQNMIVCGWSMVITSQSSLMTTYCTCVVVSAETLIILILESCNVSGHQPVGSGFAAPSQQYAWDKRLDYWQEKAATILRSVYVLELRPKICARDIQLPFEDSKILDSKMSPICKMYFGHHGSSHCVQLSHMVSHCQCLHEPIAEQ